MKKKSGKKKVSRICSYLLIASMIVGGLALSPIGATKVQAAAGVKNVNLGFGGIKQGQNKLGSKIYFASKGTPIEWHAMSSDNPAESPTSTITLLADDVVEKSGTKAISYDDDSYVWVDSKLCEWLNNTDVANGFIGSRFTAKEQEVINDNYDSTGKKIAIPSIEEVEGSDNWFSSNDDRKVSSVTESSSPFWWFLRSPGSNVSNAASVENDGNVYSVGYFVFNLDGSARPAFNLNLSSVLFSSASGESKSNTFAVTSDGSGISSWKLTLKGTDSTLNPTKANGNAKLQPGYSAETLTINHSVATTLTDATQVSAMLTDSDGTVLYYGKINGTTSATNSSVTIPEGLAVGNYSLYIFAEDVNGNTETDYASALGTPIQITVGNPPPAPVPNHNDSDNSSDGDSSTKEEAYVNPLVWTYPANQSGSLCLIEHQGELCVAAFNQVTQKGFKEAFSLNLLLEENGLFKPSHVKKTGKFVLNIPKEYQKKGRTFMLIGIDKFGNTKTFSEMDLSDETFTTTLDIKGYAFSFIYADGGKR